MHNMTVYYSEQIPLATSCEWIVDEQHGELVFCGCKPMGKTSYCHTHYQLAYVTEGSSKLDISDVDTNTVCHSESDI